MNKSLSEQYAEFPVGVWVRNKRPYFGEPVKRVVEHNGYAFTVEHGPGWHNLNGQRELVFGFSFDTYYRKAGLPIRAWLWAVWGLRKAWRAFKRKEVML